MKTLAFLVALFLTITVGAETFKSHSTVMITRDSANIETKTIFWWKDWSLTLPEDGSHMSIHVFKKKIVIDNASCDVYTLDKWAKPPHFAQIKHQLGAVFVYNAIDQEGKKWIVTICRSDQIYAIQIEDSNKIIVYQ
jgi:hypothetical protein